MPVTADQLMSFQIEDLHVSYDVQRTQLYALSLNVGHDPLDREQLKFVTETGTQTLPTMAAVIGIDFKWAVQAGLNLTKILHGEQRIRLAEPIPKAADTVTKSRIVSVIDKGAEKGALVIVRAETENAKTQNKLFEQDIVLFARGDGGCGTAGEPDEVMHHIPDRAPDLSHTHPTTAQQALLYRLNGDINPLHSNPDVAKMAGFDRPILHGLCSYGIACYAVVAEALDFDPTKITSFNGRFTAPVIPGETIRTDMWQEPDGIAFRAYAEGKDKPILDGGFVTLRN